MNTRELLEKIPHQVRITIENLRRDYNNDALNKAEVRCRAAGYTQGLRDAGMITERERQTLFVYTTIAIDHNKIHVGDKVTIQTKLSWANGEWGIVKAIDDDGYYHVAIANDEHSQLLFDRDELKK